MPPLNARVALYDAVSGEHVGYFLAMQPGAWCKADQPNQAMVLEVPEGTEGLRLKILKADFGLGEIFLVPAYGGPDHPLMTFVLDGRSTSGDSVALTLSTEPGRYYSPAELGVWTVEESAEGAMQELKAQGSMGRQKIDLKFCVLSQELPAEGEGDVVSPAGTVFGLPTRYFTSSSPAMGTQVRLLLEPAGDPPFIVN